MRNKVEFVRTREVERAVDFLSRRGRVHRRRVLAAAIGFPVAIVAFLNMAVGV
jgi:hypothetical protein